LAAILYCIRCFAISIILGFLFSAFSSIDGLWPELQGAHSTARSGHGRLQANQNFAQLQQIVLRKMQAIGFTGALSGFIYPLPAAH
jgi:hypothetical protein